jgi:undecaprenyl-diphosphatase
LNLLQLVILGLVEGVADVLPIDATSHTLLFSRIVGWRAGTIGIAIDLGSALALALYLWRDIGLIGQGLWRLRRRRLELGARLLFKVLLAAAPWTAAVVVLGLAPLALPSSLVAVGAIVIVVGLVMAVADRLCMTVNRVEHVGVVTALIIGLVQLSAVVTGVGRVAIGLTLARMLGLERPSAYRFVLLSSIPVLLAEAYARAVVFHLDSLLPGPTELLAMGITTGLVLLAVAVVVPWTNRIGLLPFALYRLALGAVLIVAGLRA